MRCKYCNDLITQSGGFEVCLNRECPSFKMNPGAAGYSVRKGPTERRLEDFKSGTGYYDKMRRVIQREKELGFTPEVKAQMVEAMEQKLREYVGEHSVASPYSNKEVLMNLLHAALYTFVAER